MPRPPFVLLAAGLLAAGEALGADELWGLCPPQPPVIGIERLQEVPDPDPSRPDTTMVVADEMTSESRDRVLFSGGVVIRRGEQLLSAQEALYDRDADTVAASGDVRFQSEQTWLQGDRATFALDGASGVITPAQFVLPDQHGRGAASLVRFVDRSTTLLENATYTTCPEGSEAWLLTTDRMELRRDRNEGIGHNISLRVGGVPVLYLPWISFPLEGRKTGFLTPEYSSSEVDGLGLEVPWYWNIAPNRDATLTAHYMERRGTMAKSEYRYLHRNSAGRLQLDYLADDALYGSDRYFAALDHSQSLGPRTSMAVNWRQVSDADYFADLDNEFSTVALTHLERRLEVNHRRDRWSWLLRAQDFQSLVAGAEPYRRLPQLLVTGADSRDGWGWSMLGDVSRFAHEFRDPTGTRLDLRPTLSRPVTRTAWFLTPRLEARHTQYWLDDGTTLSRTLPILSVDSGVFLERDTGIAGTPLLQTLEPRLFYLYVPFEDQSALPRFDTGLTGFNFPQLFRPDRFTGADRVGDANQLTLALTSRFIGLDDGRELLRGSIGQALYLDDQRVGLTATSPTVSAGRSDLLAELAGQPLSGLDLAASGRWDEEDGTLQESALRGNWSAAGGARAGVAYRMLGAGSQANVDALFQWPLSDRWRTIGRWYYDLVNERPLESVVGLEYESCCWGVRTLLRSRSTVESGGEILFDRSIHLTLQLKGLGDVGQSLEGILGEGILGI